MSNEKKDLAHTPSLECGGDKGIRPSVPFGGKRSETKRYVISHATYCNDKAARAQGGIRKRLDCTCQTFSCATQAEPTLVEIRGFEPLTYALRARNEVTPLSVFAVQIAY